MQRRSAVLAIGALILGTGWYLFRPERLFINKIVDESLPDATTMTGSALPAALTADPAAPILTGQFHSNAHETKGTASIHLLSDGKRVLRLTGFETSNGPDVRVYLVAANDVNDDATVKSAGFIEVGALKGNKGDQNYDIPAAVDLQKYRAVTIWCRRFSVNFGTAPLS